MSVLGKFVKQPGEILDYDVDFTDWFGNRADVPESFTVTADTGITVVNSMLIGKAVKVILADGVDGEKYKVTVRMTTDSTIVKEADFVVAVKES